MATEDSSSEQMASDTAEPLESSEPLEQPTQAKAASDAQNAAPLAAPALNREQRRAQAKGKKSGPAGANPALGHFNNRANPNSRSGGAPVEKRLPRTGHK